MRSRVAIPIALYRPQIRPPARNGKKMAEKWILAPLGQKEEKWPKNGKICPKMGRPFFCFFPGVAKIHFSAIFFPFRAGGPILGLYRAIGIASQEAAGLCEDIWHLCLCYSHDASNDKHSGILKLRMHQPFFAESLGKHTAWSKQTRLTDLWALISFNLPWEERRSDKRLSEAISKFPNRSPLPNISTPSPPKTRFGDPQKPSPRKCRKIAGNSGFPIE